MQLKDLKERLVKYFLPFIIPSVRSFLTVWFTYLVIEGTCVRSFISLDVSLFLILYIATLTINREKQHYGPSRLCCSTHVGKKKLTEGDRGGVESHGFAFPPISVQFHVRHKEVTKRCCLIVWKVGALTLSSFMAVLCKSQAWVQRFHSLGRV